MAHRLRTLTKILLLTVAGVFWIGAVTVRFPLGGRYWLTGQQLNGAASAGVIWVLPEGAYQSGDAVAVALPDTANRWAAARVEEIYIEQGAVRIEVLTATDRRAIVSPGALLGRVERALPLSGDLFDQMRTPAGWAFGLLLPLAGFALLSWRGAGQVRYFRPPPRTPPRSRGHAAGAVPPAVTAEAALLSGNGRRNRRSAA
jgi:hypothetical protein